MGSISHKVVRRRAAMILGFFHDMMSYKWDFMALRHFRVAAWMRGRVVGGSKSAAASVNQILRLVQSSTDCPCHYDHHVVEGQIHACGSDENFEPFVKAKDVEIDIIFKLEEMVTNAETAGMVTNE